MESAARDVLPTGVRRRLWLRGGALPAVLLGELLAGVALGAAWPRHTSPASAQAQLLPATAVRVPVTAPAVLPAVEPVAVVTPAPVRTPAAAPTPRNPFSSLAR